LQQIKLILVSNVKWTEFGSDSDDDGNSYRSDDTLADDRFTKDEVISYLVYKMAQKKQLGFVSGEKWVKLSAECRKYLGDMPPDVRAELCTWFVGEMQGEGGNLKANSAKTSGQEPDNSAGNETDDDAPTGGCLMIQEAVRELNKKKAAAQSKKAGSTRKDADPGDNRSMMSQNKKGRKDKRSEYTLQRVVSTTVHAPGSNTLEPSENLIVRASGSNTLEPSEDLFGTTEESSSSLTNPIASIPDRASQECRTLTIATSDLNRHNARSGESITHDSDGFEFLLRR
jgi:hypothetical protein